jgi:hypothetical protein
MRTVFSRRPGVLICPVLVSFLTPPLQAARGTSIAASGNAISNGSYGPLSAGSGPFTIAFWFKSGNLNPPPTYIIEGAGVHSAQWSVIYGYSSQQIEFFTTAGAAVRASTGITITDLGWHHIAYRKSASGTSAWDKFLDGVKTPINEAISFSLPVVNSFYTFNADNGQAPCQCSMADVLVYNSALSDAELQALAAGALPNQALVPLLYWPLSGISNVEPDASGNNHTGAVHGNVFHVAPPPYSGAVARGASVSSRSNVISNRSYGPLSGSNGPFTIAFWFRSRNVQPPASYIVEAHGSGQWSVIYGYQSQHIEFYTGDPTVRLNTGIAITDATWHHIAYRKSGVGASGWDKFLDGVKTTINSSINFSLPVVSGFYALNADNAAAPCQCDIADIVVYNSARPDAEILRLSNGDRPILNPAPLLYWPLAGTSAQEPDDSGNQHPGSVSGSVIAVPGPPYNPLAARAVPNSSAGNLSIMNSAFGPLSGSNGPFTVTFWFQSLNVNPMQSYVVEGYQPGPSEWAVIYGYTPQQIEFYTGVPAVRQNTGIAIRDGGWHHIAYRKAAAGASAWDKFLDGAKTPISASINFSLPPVTSFYTLNADNGLALCHCSLADVAVYSSALSDADIANLAKGLRPLATSVPPILYWPLSGSYPESDLSANNNPGTVVGRIITDAAPPYAGTVSISPPAVTLNASMQQQFTATVIGSSPSIGWFATSGTISTAGLYQAPSPISVPTTAIVSAVNASDPTKYGTASVQLNPTSPPPSSFGVFTAQYDTLRTSSNPFETILNPSNVNVSSFGKRFSLNVDGYVYAQPLYVPASAVPGLGHDTLVVATMHNSLYVFDADLGGSPLWSMNFGPSVTVARSYLGPETGILSTPVIDPNRGTVYLVALTSSGWYLHAIDLVKHMEKAGSPVLIQGSVPGTGYDSLAGVVTFATNQQLQRAGLLLANNTVYVAFTSYGDTDPYHGWIFAYDANTLAKTAIFNTTPNGQQGSIWMSGAGPAADENGNIYVVTANGTWDGGADLSETFLKLSPSLSVLDWFTPSDWSSLNRVDGDLGSTRGMLLPSTSLIIGGGKEGVIDVVNTAPGQMGHLQPPFGSPPVQSFHATTDLLTTGVETNGLYNGLAYWNAAPGGSLLYVSGSNDVVKSFQFIGGLFNTTAVAQTSTTRPFPGGVLAVSSNYSSGGILWATTPDGPTNDGTASGVLRAFDALTLAELWNSTQNVARDGLGTFAKFAAPTVANGKVYVPTFSNQVVVYGLLH